MAIKRIGNRAPTVLNIEQKIAAALLLFLFTGGIFFGFRSFGANLYRPIQQQFADNVTGKDVVHENAQEQKDMEALKKKDTDGDILSDYDELYVYKTSPYLKDSDSDVIDDKTEVFGGTDPNCPAGKECGGETISSEQTGTQSAVADDLLTSTSNSNGSSIVDAGKVQFKNKADIEAFYKKATMKEVRASLLQSGQISQEAIDKMSDDELQKFFEQAVSQASASGAFDSMITTPAATEATDIEPVPPSNIIKPKL